MRIRIISFGLVVTTKEELKCHSVGCRRNLAGKRGYVKFVFKGLNYYDYMRINICRNCFDNMIKGYGKERKGITIRYKKLLRKLLIGKLKK